MTRVLSYGGGTQSAALALMSAAGDLPKLDAVIFADTQGELPATYTYAEYVKERLVEAGIPFHRITAGDLEQTLLADAPTNHNPTPPAHVLNPDGSPGRINAYRCSYDFKRRIITAATKKLVGGRGAWKRVEEPVEQWIGFSVDEIKRCKPDHECRCGHPRARHRTECDAARCTCAHFDPWRVNVWPLIKDFGLEYRRVDTIAWFNRHGHPTPPRSACWFCPNSRNDRWRDLQAQHPDLFERACQLDEHIRNGAGFNARGNVAFAGQMFLHDSRVPLRDADLRSAGARTEATGQGALFDEAVLANDCESGVCFT